MTQQRQDPTPPAGPDPRRSWALALLCGAFFMVILDAAIVTVALPSYHSSGRLPGRLDA